MEAPNVILGVIGADCHSVGNKILEKVFTLNGLNVINLGVMVSQEEFIDAALEANADLICISSLYGHGELDCEGFRDRCIERGLEDIILYVGGNLVIGKKDFSEIKERFIEMGFDRVFNSNEDLNKIVTLIKHDVTARVAVCL